MTWRVIRQIVLLVTVAAVAALAIAPAVASTGGSVESSGAVAEPVHRLALSPSSATGADTTFTATLSSSADGARWVPAAGEAVTFAYVTDGAGYVSAVNGGPIGSMSCVTDAAGQCTISVHTDAPGDAVVTAVSSSARASSAVA